MNTVDGTTQGETLSGHQGVDTKIDGKQGDDIIKGSNGNDLILGGQGSDVLFGGLGQDTFMFTKFSSAGDTDYVIDWELGRDLLAFGDGVSIKAANIVDAGSSFNGVGLANDAKVLDLMLTLHVEDGGKSYDFQVTLVDSLKNTGWHETQVEAYLAQFGFQGDIAPWATVAA
jgi:Ca2+-binding RTX toxin-like protein